MKSDFLLIKNSGFSVIRIFLLWEDFQPEPSRVSLNTVKNLIDVADIARDSGVKIVPTFFTGHMSGANWLPDWMLSGEMDHSRFPIISGFNISKRFFEEIKTRKNLKTIQTSP